MRTTWGYTIEGEHLAPLLDIDRFNVMTGGQYKDAERVMAEIHAAGASIRNFVGWHLYPSEVCTLDVTATDRRVTPVGRDLMVQLPARHVTDVESVTVGGVEYTDYSFDPDGLLILYDLHLHHRRDHIVVTYTAGLDTEMMAAIHELVAHRVTHAIAVPAGITSEASGGVSVTYNANWINNSRATALMGDNKELLIPYKVQGVF